MKRKPLVSIVILNYNTSKLTLNLLDSIEKRSDFEIILVDNSSTDGSWESFKKLKKKSKFPNKCSNIFP